MFNPTINVNQIKGKKKKKLMMDEQTASYMEVFLSMKSEFYYLKIHNQLKTIIIINLITFFLIWCFNVNGSWVRWSTWVKISANGLFLSKVAILYRFNWARFNWARSHKRPFAFALMADLCWALGNFSTHLMGGLHP